VKVDVAVIPAAGRGTRMRPATRVVPKALLTVVDRPAIQYAVEEAARAGATEAILVVDLDVGHLIHQHFAPRAGCPDSRTSGFVRSSRRSRSGLGHAVFEAQEMVAGRPFFCILADDIVPPGRDVLPNLAAAAEGYDSVMYLRPVPPEVVPTKGIAIPSSEVVDNVLSLSGSVEKPVAGGRPVRSALIGRYLFTPEIFSILATLEPGHGGEIQLTDAIDELGKRGRLQGLHRRHRPPRHRQSARDAARLDGPRPWIASATSSSQRMRAAEVKPLADAQRDVLPVCEVLPGRSTWISPTRPRPRALRADVVAPHDVPPFANSAMDGFAVQGSDVSPRQMPCSRSSRTWPPVTWLGAVRKGTAIRIMTGAPMPTGADTVVRVEDTEVTDGKVRSEWRRPGTAVRMAGGDVRRRKVVFPPGPD
jgi:UTP--glucose-1-phosphate uridylyltransferase